MSYSHLNLNDRIEIQIGLDQGHSINQIARAIGKNPATVLREIQRHKQNIGKRSELLREPCAKKESCVKMNLCSGCHNSLCKHCDRCRTFCIDYEPVMCATLLKSPYVCNKCRRKKSCPYPRVMYYANTAQNEYKQNLYDARSGVDIAPDRIHEVDQLVSPLLKRGQTVSHIYANHGDDLGFSRTTFYKYIDSSLFTARSIDLPRKVRFRKRKNALKGPVKTKEARISILKRDYKHFLAYMEKNEDIDVVEMDTVEGSVHSKKCLLTLLFRSCNLMLAILLPEKTQENVISALNDLCNTIGIETFRALFPVILTDRGTEFTDPVGIEGDVNGEIKTHLFYCDPQASWQKGALEKNHEFIRYVVPKGNTFDHYDQEDITLMINHINSLARDKFHGTTPFKLSQILLNPKLHEAMGLEEIRPDDVHLKPSLLSSRHLSG